MLSALGSPLGDTAIGVLLALGATLVFSVCIILSTVGSRQLDSDASAVLAGAANIPVGLALMGLMALGGHRLASPTPSALLWFALGGLCAIWLGRWLFFRAIRLMGPTRASVFQTLSPLITALFAWAFLGDGLGWVGLVGMLVAVAGLVVTTQRRPAGGASGGAVAVTARLALAIGLGAATAYAASSVFRGAGLREWNEPLAGSTLGAVAGWAVLLWMSRRRLPAVRAQVRAHPRSARVMLLVGGMQIVAQTLMVASMNHIAVWLAVLVTSCTPLLVMPLSARFLRRDETLDARLVFGAVLTCVGVGLAVVADALG
jgi:drug/metabolite transporter (DMT)-like permease